MIDTPLYQYGNTEIPSPNDGALFHFTRFESLLKILGSMTIRSSPLYKMNDLNEANIDCIDWNADLLLMLKAEKYIKEQCSIISFSRNYMVGSICEEGTNHPAMWAHYAEDSNGACIVFDKDSLIENNKELLAKFYYKIEPIKYSHHCTPKDGFVNNSYLNVSDFVKRNYEELFFKKHVDWSYEDEVRFFVEAPEVFLDIKGAIKYIVLGGRLKNNEQNMMRLIEQLITPGSRSYRGFSMHSFAEMRSTVNGYMTVDASSTIFMTLKKLSQKLLFAQEYLDWHDSHFS